MANELYGSNRDFAEYNPRNQSTYQGPENASSFSSWLQGLPSDQQLSPLNVPLQKAGIGPDLTPALWKAFAPYGESLINQGAQARLRGVTEGVGNSRRELERTLLDTYSGAGLNPIFAQAQLAETAQQPGLQLSQARGDIESQRLEQLFGFSSGINNALADSFGTNRGLALSAYFGGKGLDVTAGAAKTAGKAAVISSALESSSSNPFGG